MLTDAQLQQIMPNLAPAKRALYLPHLVAAMQAHAVDTALRTAAFVAQLAHESGEFRWMEEIWGPTDAQRRYEPPSPLAQRLGNTQPGDGKRFKGRGPIQITGRFNYRKYGALLGIDLEADPDRAATPEVAFATAGLYWQTNGLSELADERDFIAITKRINGGTNGLADRQKYYARALGVLAPAAPRSQARATPLTRGHEAIVADAAVDPSIAVMASGARAATRTTTKSGSGGKPARLAAPKARVVPPELGKRGSTVTKSQASTASTKAGRRAPGRLSPAAPKSGARKSTPRKAAANRAT